MPLLLAATHAGAKDPAEVADRLWRQAHAASIPAMALVTVDGDRPPIVAVYGDGVDLQTPFRWGSVTKTVTALTLIELARERGVDLSTPVAALLQPSLFDNPWEATAPLRIDHLLELTAGLADLTAAEFADTQPLALPAALARGAADRRLLWPPGLQHGYSNAAAGFSEALIEALGDGPYAQQVDERVFRPLGMIGAGFDPDPRLPGGYQADGVTEIPYWHMTFRAFGALNAPPAAMGRLVRALLHDARGAERPALAAASVARLYRNQTGLGAAAGLEIGYGAGLYGWVSDGHLFYGHGGDADGYRSRLGLLPAAGRGYLLVINTDNPGVLRAMTRQVEAFLTEDLPPPAAPAASAPDPALLERFSGSYYPAGARFGIARWQSGQGAVAQVSPGAGGLRVRIRDTTTTLLHQDGGRFRRPGDPAVAVVFIEHDGDVYLQGELGNFVRIRPGRCPAYIGRCEPW